jgi:hypothetical protein
LYSFADVQVSPYDTFHSSKAKRTHECIGKLHAGRPEWTVKGVCPDLVSGVICGDCNAEGFVVANYLLARSGLSGEANTESIPVAVLKIQASRFIDYPTMIPFEDMLWAFGAFTYTSEQITNGCEIRAWDILQKEKSFKRLVTWYPKSLTRNGERHPLSRRTPLNKQLIRRDRINRRWASYPR